MATRMMGTMDSEMLARYRIVEARCKAVEANPTAFSQQETINAFVDQYRMHGEISTKFDLEPSRTWSASPADGVVIHGEWED